MEAARLIQQHDKVAPCRFCSEINCSRYAAILMSTDLISTDQPNAVSGLSALFVRAK